MDFEKLKKCKTVKEIYMTIGPENMRKPAGLILVLWACLPLWSVWSHFFWGYRMGFIEGTTPFIWAAYRDSTLLLGQVTLLYLFFYLIGLLVLKKVDIPKTFLRSPWNLCFLCMLLWAIPATVFSQDPGLSFWGSDYRFEGLLTFFFYGGVYCLARIVNIQSKRQRYYRVFMVVACILSIALILQDAGVPYVTDVFSTERATVFFQFNHMGYYLCMSILCSMGLILFDNSKGWGIFSVMAVFLQMYALLVNSTLGGYLGVLVGLLSLIVFVLAGCSQWDRGKKLKRALLIPISLFLITTVMSYAGAIPTSSGEDMKVNIQTMYQDTANLAAGEGDSVGHGRMTLWKTGLKMIPKHPVLGYGPENMDRELMDTIWNDRIDNEFIQYAISIGIPGALFYLAGLCLLAVYRGRRLKHMSGMGMLAAGCVFGYLCSSCLGNSMFYTTPYFFIFLGFVGGEDSI